MSVCKHINIRLCVFVRRHVATFRFVLRAVCCVLCWPFAPHVYVRSIFAASTAVLPTTLLPVILVDRECVCVCYAGYVVRNTYTSCHCASCTFTSSCVFLSPHVLLRAQPTLLRMSGKYIVLTDDSKVLPPESAQSRSVCSFAILTSAHTQTHTHTYTANKVQNTCNRCECTRL